MNKRYQVFISSTFADLKEERAKVIQTVMELDCIPAGMEIFPAIDQEQFEFIKKVIDDCDYYILIIGGRYGTLSEKGISYTEMEYNYAIEKGIKVIALIHGNSDDIPIGKSEKNEALRIKLQNFKDKVATNRLVKFWRNLEELPGLVALSLSKTIKTYPAIGWVRANTVADPELYKEINELRKENEKLLNNAPTQFTEVDKEIELAGLDDIIELSGKRVWWDNRYKQDKKSDWSIKISWGKLFSLIGPYLLENPNDFSVQKTLAKVIYETTDDYISNGTPWLIDQDFQTIKIHLKALELIELKYAKATNGGMSLFWYLTKTGEKLMLKLRSVKK
ncbi:DUF4062 domain-containing protein [uncultured Christiangramia sp.]|uniref:DUF4062 domain-containing protein n=1 Tax=Christiangramia sp. 3-2217-3z TaxID=3417564 RepID=UPI0026394766|nr:DUF4062 domain-containing protein [uncultured Christiangramia sp.]